ncbi:MAG: ion transporter [Proteobacteria bacterium]|nr:ion transporter [Pseudomonadota bacterium]
MSEKQHYSTYIENPIKRYLNAALFDLDSRLGRKVNLLGIFVIVMTVVLSMIGTLDNISSSTRSYIELAELIITGAFAIEYILRVVVARRPVAYMLSFYGLIDLLTWLPLLLMGNATLAIRLLRVIRLLKLIRYLKALHLFLSSLQDTIEIILVVAVTILIVIAISGNIIHAIEPDIIDNAFIGSWWSLVTMTTVGYGDIVPVTTGGKIIASILMVTGITIFAMLTGVISVKVSQIVNRTHACNNCMNKFSDEYGYCPYCGIEQELNRHQHCRECNAEINLNDNFCSRCGIKNAS